MNRRVFALLLALGLAGPAPLFADDCRDRIAALHDGGALDPRIRPPHRHTNTVTDAEGTVLRRFETVMESATRSVAGMEGAGLYALVLDRRSWTGPTLDGPWTENPNLLPEDRMAQIERQRRQTVANLTDTACPGFVDLDGQRLENVRFTSRTDPDPSMGNAWFGARNSVYIDPEAGRVIRWEMSDFENSWTEGKSAERHVILFDYDDAIRLPDPE